MAPRDTSSFSRRSRHYRTGVDERCHNKLDLLQQAMDTYICGIVGPLVADHLTLETKVVASIFLFILSICVHHNVHLIACRCTYMYVCMHDIMCNHM